MMPDCFIMVTHNFVRTNDSYEVIQILKLSLYKNNMAAQLQFNSEHRLRAENLSWDIDVWYPIVEEFTFKTLFLPLSKDEARAILAFHDVSWRHVKQSLCEEEIFTLRKLERDIDSLLGGFGDHIAFVRLSGRSPKDGEPLNRELIMDHYKSDLDLLLRQGQPLNGNTKMIAISRTTTLKVACGADAMSLLLTSERVYSDILDWIKFGEPDQICLREWSEDLKLENEFRVFVFGGKITAISQYDHYTYYPHLAGIKDAVQDGICTLWREVHEALQCDRYVMDVAFFPDRTEKRFMVVEFSPFLPCTGAALFSWASDISVLKGEGDGGIQFRIKLEKDIHPQIDELVEINWDMRWANPFVPYYSFYSPIEQPQTLSKKIASFFWSSSTDKADQKLPAEDIAPPRKILLFVYGTLKSNFQWNQKYLAERVGGKFLCTAQTREKIPLVVGDCGVPYLLGDLFGNPSASSIRGELYEISTTCLQNLDDYEGVSKGYYSRELINVIIPAPCGEIQTTDVEAFVYVLRESSEELRSRTYLSEYDILTHKRVYNPIKHIQIKQKNYYKVASSWGKTRDAAVDETSYAEN
jgi:gamma-glutamylcyclotransferase (GGCT)/AIG2-like uncharacterized protein YtfP